MINESFIERIVREEVRNYLFGVVGTSKRTGFTLVGERQDDGFRIYRTA
jgi:hypothetical protein